MEVCQFCNQKIKCKNFALHLKIYHGISYQTYLQNNYGLKVNYNYQITPEVWNYMYDYYQVNNKNNLSINDFFTAIFVKNNYDGNKLIEVFRKYTFAISQYCELSLNNINENDVQNLKLILLEKNENSSRSKYQNISKSNQYKTKRINSRPKVKCDICGKEYLDTSILNHVYNSHDMLRKQYLQNKFNLPDELNYDSLRYTVAQKMYEELQKSPYDNYHDCYKALFKQYGSYAKMSEALGYNVKYACEGLNIAEPQKWTDEQKDAQRQRKLGTKWTELQRQKVIEGKLKSGKYKHICGYTKEGLANENTSL